MICCFYYNLIHSENLTIRQKIDDNICKEYKIVIPLHTS